MQRYRKGSLFGDHWGTPLNREQRHKLLYLAEQLEKRTKARGRANGVLGLTALHLLRTLLSFQCKKTGRCDPSLETLVEHSGLSRSTVVRCVKRLVNCRLLKSTRRIHRVALDRCVTTVQRSNSYAFSGNLIKPHEPAEIPRSFKKGPDLFAWVKQLGVSDAQQPTSKLTKEGTR